jgi:radical SAM superfamily enzyme YgiQ (UPF0313 family)
VRQEISIKAYYPHASNGHESLVDRIRERRKNISGISKILLINPLQIPSTYFDKSMAQRSRYFSYPPYGLGILAKLLKSKNYQTEILDLNFLILSETQADEINLDRQIKNILTKALLEYKPDLVGVTCMFTLTHQSFKQTIQNVRELMPEIIIAAGGVHITNDQTRIEKEIPEIDFSLPNESEFALIEVLDTINGKNESENTDGLRIEKYDFSNLTPDYCNLPIGEYSNYGEVGSYRFWWRQDTRAATIQGNRGCRARCTFCSVENFNGKGVRGRSISSVVSEIEHYKKTYGINHFMWLDDDLFYDPNRALQLFKTLEDAKLDVTWDASNGVIASALSDELLSAAQASGCIGMHVGIESGSPRILKEVRKPSGIKHFINLGKWLTNYPKIFTKGFLIMGFPNETYGELMQTIDLAREMDLDWYTVSVLTPLPSTKIYDQMVDLGLIADQKIESQNVNYGSMQTGTQKNLEEKNRLKAGDFLKINDQLMHEKLDRTKLTELWFEVDYLINYKRLTNEISEEKAIKMAAFLGDINDRMTAGTNPVSLYYEGIIQKRLGSQSKSLQKFIHANDALAKSDLWQKRCEYIQIGGNINAQANSSATIIA